MILYPCMVPSHVEQAYEVVIQVEYAGCTICQIPRRVRIDPIRHFRLAVLGQESLIGLHTDWVLCVRLA